MYYRNYLLIFISCSIILQSLYPMHRSMEDALKALDISKPLKPTNPHDFAIHNPVDNYNNENSHPIEKFKDILQQSNNVLSTILQENAKSSNKFSSNDINKIALLIHWQKIICEHIENKPRKIFRNVTIHAEATADALNRWQKFIEQKKVAETWYAPLKKISDDLNDLCINLDELLFAAAL